MYIKSYGIFVWNKLRPVKQYMVIRLDATREV